MSVVLGQVCDPVRAVRAATPLSRLLFAFQSALDRKAYIIAEEGRPSGIVTRAAIMELAATSGADVIPGLSAGDIASPCPPRLPASMTITQFTALRKSGDLDEAAISALIIDQGKLLGQINQTKLIEALGCQHAPVTPQVPQIVEAAPALKAVEPQNPPIETADTPDTPDMLATLAHEIRTPLTGIIGLSDLLVKRAIDEDAKEIAQKISRAGEALDRIVTDTLDFARLGAGKVSLKEAPTDPATITETVRALWSQQAERRNLTLTTCLSPDVPSLVTLDSGRVLQVVNNLVNNALKFTSAGSVDVAVSAQQGRDTMELIVEVTDTGPGLSPADKTRMFKAFESGAAETGMIEGWGLGLTIASSLVRHMGGRLSVADNPEGGSVFTVGVPTRQVRGAQLNLVEAPRSGKFVLGDILIIEDHDASAYIATDALTTAGWNVVRANNLGEAERLMGVQSFQIILADLHLPDGHAREFVSRARALPGPSSTVPIVGVTADISPLHDAAIEQAGFDRLVRKPVSGPALVATMADVLMADAAGQLNRAPQLRGRLAG